MTGRRPLLISTLTAADLDAAREEINALGTAAADVAEVRFDRWERAQIPEAKRLFPSSLPLLATYRSREEGGSGADDPRVRATILRELAMSPFTYLDVEATRDASVADEVRRTTPRPLLVVSTHLSTAPEARRHLSQIGPPAPGDAFAKLVFPADAGSLVREVLPQLPPPDFPYVVHTTGPSGPLLRAWGKQLGLAAVYVGPPAGSGKRPVEPSQLPVDRLRRFFDSPGPAPLFAVVGHPVGHSKSPDLHASWMEHDGAHGLYLSLDLDRDSELLDLLPVLGTRGFRGLNVTHPLKPAALQAATRATPGAEACQCANVLTFEGDEILGDNTDLVAILRRLSELRGEGWNDDRLTLVGTGGAARATLAAARELGVECEILARNGVQASELARTFGATVGDPTRGPPASLVVNGTPVGHPHAGALEVPLDHRVSRSTRILDWVYGNEGQGLRAWALARGVRYEDGSRLLEYQAAASYELWWGHPPDLEAPPKGVTDG